MNLLEQVKVALSQIETANCTPLKNLHDCLNTSSIPTPTRGETVLDNTMGSGSTMVVCWNTKRNGIGIELNEEYFKIAEKRIKDEQQQLKLF